MSNLARYFESTAYKAKWEIGDRVTGKWNRIPFVGTVGNDRLISDVVGPEVTVHLDLPIKHNNKIHNVIIVKHKDIKAYK